MTKRHQIEKAMAMLDSHIKQNTCLDCPEIFTLLLEYQATLPLDREPWELAYRKRFCISSVEDISKREDAIMYCKGYTDRIAEKQEGSK